MLDQIVLNAFEDALRNAGAGSVVDALAPGLAGADLDRWEQELGMALSTEARRWWGWRNGGPRDLLPHTTMISLEQAVMAQRDRLEQAQAVASHPQVNRDPKVGAPEFCWNPRWLPLVGPFGQDMITIDCGLPATQPSPVRRVDWSRTSDADYAVPRAPSLGALVQHWTALLRSGEVRFDPQADDWLWASRNQIFLSDGAA